MHELIDFLFNIVNLGLIFTLIVLSVYISSTVLKFDDLTLEGSFGLGGALGAILLLNDIPVFFSFLCVACAGAVVGSLTGILHTRLVLNNLICGLILTTALFSLNLRFAGAHLAVSSTMTFGEIGNKSVLTVFPILVIISLGILCLVALMLRTEIGYMLKAVGSNVHMVRILGKNVNGYIIGGLALANALTSLSGMLLVHYTGFFSITGSIGILVVAMAGLMIGTSLCKRPMIGIVLGAITYQLIIALTLELNVDPVWNKLLTAGLMLLLVLRNKKNEE